MTFEQYKKGLVEIIKKSNHDRCAVEMYNSRVSKQCNFSVNVADLMEKIVMVSNMQNFEVEAIPQLTPDYMNDKKPFAGVLKIQNKYNLPHTNKPVISEIARFPLYTTTQFTDGTILRDNAYVQKDYGRASLKFLPGVRVQDIIVKLDLNANYMLDPYFVKALFKCNIIEDEQTLTK